MARPITLTPHKIERLCQFVAAGNTVETSATAAGMSPRVYYKYQKLGKEEIARITGTNKQPAKNKELYVQLVQDVEKAKAEAIAMMVLHIAKAAPKNWQAAAWWLERNYPKTYGRTSKDAAIASDTAGALLEAVAKYAEGNNGSPLPTKTID